MNIIIYTVLFLTSLYFLLKFFGNIASKKISQGLRSFLFIGLVILAILFAVGGKILLSLPLTIISLALLKRHINKGELLPFLSKKTQATLKAYSWPGNVRELENVLQRALVLSNNVVIHEKDIMIDNLLHNLEDSINIKQNVAQG